MNPQWSSARVCTLSQCCSTEDSRHWSFMASVEGTVHHLVCSTCQSPAMKTDTLANTHRSGRESVSEQERENILFLPCNQRLCKHTHKHTQGCLLSEAFPRCCGTKLHTRMGGWSEGGMDGSTEGWRVSLQQLRLTAGINTSLSRGLYLG